MGTSTPVITVEGSPISRLLHPKTKVSPEDAARKHAADKYMDKRSPVMSPKVKLLPDITYDNLRSPIVERQFSVKQPSRVNSPVRESSTSKLPQHVHRAPSPVLSVAHSVRVADKTHHVSSARVADKTPQASQDVYVEDVYYDPYPHSVRSDAQELYYGQNYSYSHATPNYSRQSPKKSLRVTKQDDGYYVVVDEYEEVEEYEQQSWVPPAGKTSDDLLRETYERMTDLERARAIWSMCSEIKRLAEQHPQLGLQLMPDDGTVDVVEIHAYLLFVRERISQEEKMNVLDLAMNSIYTFSAWALEKFLDVPMKGYFDSLRATVGDYRTLIMDNTDVSKFISSILPSVSAPQTSLAAIMTMFFGQVLAGCAVAVGAKWWGGGGKMTEMAAKTAGAGASRVNSHLNDYMFKGGSFFGTIGAIGRSVFGGGKPPSNPVDV